ERLLLARVPALQRLYRAAVYVQYESRALLYVYFPRLFGIAERLALRHLRRQVGDPDLRRKLTPDYTLGCKRVLLMNTYYPALTRPNLDLVTDPIARVTPGAIVTADGQVREVDAIIFGTGFNVEHALHAGQVRGRGGKLLFQDDLQAYKGCTVAGFPNYFLITGPNTGLGHNSMIYMIESGVRYAVDAVQTIRARGLHSVEVTAQAQRAFNLDLQRRMRGTVWSTGCKSWYLDAAGHNYTLWPGFTFAYRRLTRRFDIENYRVSAGA
ncbi:MAG TPA: NAD(P)/FAD-dependent oxidoreductase, partial [Telluria sp.]